MEMNTRLLSLPLLFMLVASLAACGGGSPHVPANAVALVDGQPIAIADFNTYFQQAVKRTIASGQPEPKPGSPTYATLHSQVAAELVQIAEVKQQAQKEGVSVTPSEVNKFIANLIKTNYKGDKKKFLSVLRAQGLDMKFAESQVSLNLLGQKLHTKVISSAKVTPAQEQEYYKTHLLQYKAAPSTTRSVEYILFKCAASGTSTCPAAKNSAEKKKADMVEKKLKSGASFEAMAKQYSDDATTAPQGGKFSLVKGGVVPAFDTAGFALKTGAYTQQPVDATSTANQGYGWFIIKALAPPKTTPAHTTPFKTAEPSIKQTLLSQEQTTLWQKWLADLQNSYKGKITYAAAYAPPTTTAAAPGATLTTPTG